MRWFSLLFRKQVIELDLDKELRYHLERRISDHVNAGMPPLEARRRARLEFGGLDQVKEDCRDTRGLRWADDLRQDVRYAVRTLGRSPGFAAVALLVLALGIGINTAVFSIVNFALFRPLPVHAPRELASIYYSSRGSTRLWSIPYDAYQSLKEHKDVFSGIMAWRGMTATLATGSRSELSLGEAVSADYFDVLGVVPEIGRRFTLQQDPAASQPVVIISHSLKDRLFPSDTEVIGRSIKLNGQSLTIIGVAPADFKGLWFPGVSSQYWVPMGTFAEAERNPVLVIGRLAPGATFARASALTDTIGRQRALAFPEIERDRTYKVLHTSSIRVFMDPESDRIPGWISVALMSVVAIVLLIAAANITGILMARAMTRGKEIAVRIALGAGRWRLMRQLLTETVLLTICGGILGLGISRLILALVLYFTPNRFQFAEISVEVPTDLRVLLFTVLVCMVTGLLVGIQPAWRASKTNLVTGLCAEGMATPHVERSRLRHWILIPQVCFSLLLLILAGLFITTLSRYERVDTGFDAEHVATVSVDVRFNNYTDEQGRAFYRRLLERAKSLPGITAVSLTDYLPLSVEGRGATVAMPEGGSRENARAVSCARISPGYFHSLGIRIERGRDFAAVDGASAPRVAILTEQAARIFWPGVDPVGKRLKLSGRKFPPVLQVVGIVSDIRTSFSEFRLPFIYLPMEQDYASGMNLVARTPGKPSQTVERLRTLVYEVDDKVGILDSKTMAENIALTLFPMRAATVLLSLCGFFGLLLATVGLYGVVSYSVAQRTREIGIRTALGARKGNIIRMVLKEGFKVTLIGSVLGVLLAIAVRRVITLMTVGAVTLDASVIVGMPIFIAGIILLSCYIPASRAARVDPMEALREL